MLSTVVYDELAKERDELKKRLSSPGLDRHSMSYLNNRIESIRKTLKDAHRDKYHRSKGV